MTSIIGRRARALLLTLAALIAWPASACLGTVRPDPALHALTLAPARLFDLPVRLSRAYWLLRPEPGWQAAQETRYGGVTGDPAVALVRAARFISAGTASAAFERLTPAYVARAWPEFMTAEPWPTATVLAVPADEATALTYLARWPASDGEEAIGTLLLARSGALILVIEGVGLPDDDLIGALRLLLSEAERGQARPP